MILRPEASLYLFLPPPPLIRTDICKRLRKQLLRCFVDKLAMLKPFLTITLPPELRILHFCTFQIGSYTAAYFCTFLYTYALFCTFQLTFCIFLHTTAIAIELYKNVLQFPQLCFKHCTGIDLLMYWRQGIASKHPDENHCNFNAMLQRESNIQQFGTRAQI